MKNSSKFLWLEYIAVSIIVIAFFVISYCGFFAWDDIYMNYGVSSLSDVIEHTKMFYFTYGGRLFSTISQYLFSGVLGSNKLWFDIVNTLFFVLWITICGRLINENNKNSISYVLLFALLFWFLCPIPSETLFWVAGSTVYLWANTLTFVFLFFFMKYKDDNFGFAGKLGLFFFSVFASTEYITCASICGAFVVYYAFHIKKFKRNAVPFVVGFAIGSVLLLFAPGGFKRGGIGDTSISTIIHSNLYYLLHHPVAEIVKYKALWMFLVSFVFGWIRNKKITKVWAKKHSILLLSLGWSLIAFNVVFGSPAIRALFFTESLSLVLLLRFLFDNFGFMIRFSNKFPSRVLSSVRRVAMILLFVVFIVDSVFAVVETRKWKDNNDVILNGIVDSGGIIASEGLISSHRMAHVPFFTEWTFKPLASKYGLDSVYVYPFYYQDKFINKVFPFENVYIDANDNIFGKYVRMIVGVEKEDLQESGRPIVFTINYTRPRKWYKSWLDEWRNYQYDRTVIVERDNPDDCFKGCCYYVIWLRRENAKELKSVRYEFK